MSSIRSACIGFGYRRLIRPILFSLDPERVHRGALWVGKSLGATGSGRKLTRFLLSYNHPALSQTIAGITFKNPVGLAAGFDKDAHLVPVIGDVGFGFAEIGSVTAKPCDGNKKPRLWRLKKSQSLLVHYGLANDGADAITRRIQKNPGTIPLGISIARTNDEETATLEAGIADYTRAYRATAGIGAFAVINISCPNMFCDYTFADPDRLDALLASLATAPSHKPFFIKLSPDDDPATTEKLVAVGLKHGAAGFICSNLTTNRFTSRLKDARVPSVGGMSGKVVEELSNRMIAQLYPLVKGKAILIGCGGIFCAQDAYRKIRLGASLVELVTGMIYQGPQVVGDINQDLVKLVKRDGFASIAQAVGADSQK